MIKEVLRYLVERTVDVNLKNGNDLLRFDDRGLAKILLDHVPEIKEFCDRNSVWTERLEDAIEDVRRIRHRDVMPQKGRIQILKRIEEKFKAINEEFAELNRWRGALNEYADTLGKRHQELLAERNRLREHCTHKNDDGTSALYRYPILNDLCCRLCGAHDVPEEPK